MKAEAVHDLEQQYDRILEFLEKERPTNQLAPGTSLVEYQNNFRTVPEKYLLKDNLLLLLKEA